MLFTIVFNEYGLSLDTTDMETAFHACDMPQLVEAVINAETGKVLWGSLHECELTPEQATVEEAIAEHRAWAKKLAHGSECKIPVCAPKNKKRVGGITRAEASKQYADAIGPSVTPNNRNFTVIVLYDYEPAWVGSFHGEDIAFDFFERRAKNNHTVMLYKGNRLVCRAFNGAKEVI